MFSLLYGMLKGLVGCVETGRTASAKTKIGIVYIFGILQEQSPEGMKKYFDLMVRCFLLETDVKFRIGTIYDFFVFSPSWEDELRNVFFLRKGSNFVDVGAHIGKYTVRIAKMVGLKGLVVAVEPDKDNFDLLKENLELNGLDNCIALNIAAGSTDGDILLFAGPKSAEHSTKEDFGKGFSKVKVRALDNVLAEKGIHNVDLVKIDVEGAEYEVLEGLERTLKSEGPRVVLEVLAPDRKKVVNLMRSYGYEARILNIYPSYRAGIYHYLFQKPVDCKRLLASH